MTNAIRLEIQFLYNVKAKKGEMRGPNGRLRKNVISIVSDIAEAKAEISNMVSTLDCAIFEEARLYDRAAHAADPLVTVPFKTIKH